MNNSVTSKRVFDSSSREIGNGTEYFAKMEVLYENGTKSVTEALLRRTDTDEWASEQATLVIKRFASQEDSSPSRANAYTWIIDRKKEEAEGDYRWVTSYATFIFNKGVQRLPAMRVKVPTAVRERQFSVELMLEQAVTLWGDKELEY